MTDTVEPQSHLDDATILWSPSEIEAQAEVVLRPGYVPPNAPVSNTPTLGGAPKHVNWEGNVGPDNRRFLSDRRFPWAAIGRFRSLTPNEYLGHTTGVLVGPRHVLTASHSVPWVNVSPDPAKPDLRYDAHNRPLFFAPGFRADTGPNTPFGDIPVAKVVTAMPYLPSPFVPPGVVDAATGGPVNPRALDLAVLILPEPVGLKVGWFGFTGWNKDWNGKAMWSHVGYPSLDDQEPHEWMFGRPTYQGPDSAPAIVELQTKDFRLPNGVVIKATNMVNTFDVESGHSGGPIFTWFGEEPAPRVAAVMNGRRNKPEPGHPMAPGHNASGGSYLVNMIDYALKTFP